MQNKKFTRLAVLSVLSILALAGCNESSSTIKAKPSNYDGTIVDVEGSEEKIHNDLLSIIYDEAQESNIPSATLDKVMYRYAQSVYGSYNKVTLADNSEGEITLKEAAANAKEVAQNEEEVVDYTVVKNFIKAHKSFWTYNNDGEHINDDDPENVFVVDEKNYDPSGHEIQNVASKWDDIEARIAETMYSKISSNTENHFFNEVKLVKSLYGDGQEVNYAEAKSLDEHHKPKYPSIIVPYTLEKEDVFEEEVLHREFYQTNYKIGEDESADVEGAQYHYIEKEIIPQIYSDLLIEQYLLDEELPAVRTSRARLINVIKIEKYSSFVLNANLLVKELVKEIYASRPEARADQKHYLSYVDEDNNPYEALFEKYERLSKGLYSSLSQTEKELLASINGVDNDVFKLEEGTVSHLKYYANTAYGDLVEEYEELLATRAGGYESFNSTLYNKYTNNGTTTMTEGFDRLELDIAQSKAITKGWYVQKSAPSLDGSITDSLFKNQIANYKLEAENANDGDILDAEVIDPETGKKGELAETDRLVYENGEWKIRKAPAEGEGSDLCSINGAYFLKSSGGYGEDDYKNDIVHETDDAYYIVQVVEAAKDTKLRNSTSNNSYARSRGQDFLNEVTAHITRKVAETGSYASLAKEHWLEEMSIKYHDQAIYDYFKDNYPDLFD